MLENSNFGRILLNFRSKFQILLPSFRPKNHRNIRNSRNSPISFGTGKFVKTKSKSLLGERLLLAAHEVPGEMDPAERARVGVEGTRDGGGKGAPVDAVFKVHLPDEVTVFE